MGRGLLFALVGRALIDVRPWFLALLALGFAWWLVPIILAHFIRRRLGGYVHVVNRPDPALPLRPATSKSVAVVGAGIAGLTAARTLAERGYRVCLLEKSSYLGGKLGSWSVELEPGRTVNVSHGFHAFFKHYYNLNRFLDAIGARAELTSIDDYVILSRSGRQRALLWPLRHEPAGNQPAARSRFGAALAASADDARFAPLR